MILIVNFNLVENALLEKVSTELGFAERCQYIHETVTTPKELSAQFERPNNALPRVIIINLDSVEADWKPLLKNLKADPVWRYVPILGFGFLEDAATVEEFYQFGGASCIRKPHGYEGLSEITKTAMGYWLDVSFLPSDFITDIDDP